MSNWKGSALFSFPATLLTDYDWYWLMDFWIFFVTFNIFSLHTLTGASTRLVSPFPLTVQLQ